MKLLSITLTVMIWTSQPALRPSIQKMISCWKTAGGKCDSVWWRSRQRREKSPPSLPLSDDSPTNQWPGKTAAWKDERPLFKWATEQILFSTVQLHQAEGATLQQHRPLFVFPLFHSDRQGDWIGDSGAFINPFYSQMGKSWCQDLCFTTVSRVNREIFLCLSRWLEWVKRKTTLCVVMIWGGSTKGWKSSLVFGFCIVISPQLCV